MGRRTGSAGMIGGDGLRRRREESTSSSGKGISSSSSPPSLLTRAVDSVFAFVRFAEFEILLVLFFLIAFIIFKDLTSRPEYNDILVKKPGGNDWWPY